MASKVQANLLDRMAGFISPYWGARRLAWRQYYDKQRQWDGAKKDRTHAWVPINQTAEQTDRYDRDLLRARARALERNSTMVQMVIGAYERNVVGTGIKPQPRIRDANGELDNTLNKEVVRLWNLWTDHTRCDVAGRLCFEEMQAINLRRRIVDGETFTRYVYDTSQRFPLQLQGLEPDLLDTSKYQNGSNYVLSGVEVNMAYKALAYWWNESTPDGYVTLNTSKRVFASDMLHMFWAFRWSQVRGVSELARIINDAKDTGDYIDAELLAAKIAACFAVFITKDMPSDSMGRMIEDETGKRLDVIEPGMIEYLLPGEKAEVAQPGRPAGTVRDYVDLKMQMAAAGMNLSPEIMTRDMSKATYSSARANLLEDRKVFQPLQIYMAKHFCQPVYEQWMDAAVNAGVLKIRDYWTNRDRYLACRWIAPGWQWIDPLKDAKAAKEELTAGMRTLEDVLMEQGRGTVEDVAEELKREAELFNKAGVGLDVFLTPPKADGSNEEQLRQIYQYHLENGIVTINEAREQLGLPPVDGGDVYLKKPGVVITDDPGEKPPTQAEVQGGEPGEGQANNGTAATNAGGEE